MTGGRPNNDSLASTKISRGNTAGSNDETGQSNDKLRRRISQLVNGSLIEPVDILKGHSGHGPQNAIRPTLAHETLRGISRPLMQTKEDLGVNGVVAGSNEGVDEDEIAGAKEGGVGTGGEDAADGLAAGDEGEGEAEVGEGAVEEEGPAGAGVGGEDADGAGSWGWRVGDEAGGYGDIRGRADAADCEGFCGGGKRHVGR
jgi:hypothetical protein